MIPTTTELKLAHKCQYDLYTTTNFSFMDLAQTMKLPSIQLMAVPKVDGVSFLFNESKWAPVIEAFSPISRKGNTVNF